MAIINRRKFIYSSALLAAVPGLTTFAGRKAEGMLPGKSGNILTGVISEANNPEEELKIVRDLGFHTCQLGVENYSPELAKRLSECSHKIQFTPDLLDLYGAGHLQVELH